MARRLLTLLFSIVVLSTSGQVPYQLTFGAGPTLHFDDTTSTHYFYIDTNVIGNAWQIGTPQKTLFDSAYSAPNALVTDTLNGYPTENYSTTYMSLVVAEGLMWFYFVHKYDTDTLEDGGKIELSIDGGANWHNLRDSAYWNSVGCRVDGTRLYSYQDTVASLGDQGFSGNSAGWLDTEFEFFYQNITVPMDTFQLRFVFSSDTVETNKAGWLIDDIIIGANHIGVEEYQTNQITVYPNPTNGFLRFNGLKHPLRQVYVSDGFGRKVEPNELFDGNLDISNLADGIYFITIVTDQFSKTQKVVLKK